ncbi:uncharacterized protein [Canis lupus baileyi]|uniref:uncharacterized protein isoform X1 n=1 Tax=Canis lupus baileyi TaxID=143281 RepID=UPI003B978B5D
MRTNELIAPSSYALADTHLVSCRRGHVEVPERKPPRSAVRGSTSTLSKKCPGNAFALSKDGRCTWREEGGVAPALQVRRGRWRMTRILCPSLRTWHFSRTSWNACSSVWKKKSAVV